MFTYIAVATGLSKLSRSIAQVQLASVTRFLRLRGLAGVAQEPGEDQYLQAMHKELQPGTNFWIDQTGYALVGLLIAYHVITTLF